MKHAVRDAARIPSRQNRVLALRGFDVLERVDPPHCPPKGSCGRKRTVVGVGAGSSGAAPNDGEGDEEEGAAFRAPR